MNILPIIIESMNKEEIRNFKLFINRTNSTKNRMDESLFNLIKKTSNSNYDEEKVFKKLYKDTSDKNSFYRLKNRLIEDIGISMAQFNFNETDMHYILNHYLLAKTFSLKNEWSMARYYILKAEKKAESIENYQLRDLIYSELISLSHEILEINPDFYIKKRIANRVKLFEIQELDDILATIIFKVRKSQNFSAPDTESSHVLDKFIKSSATKSKLKSNIQFKFKMYEALSRVLLSKKDYKGLESYLLSTYIDFETNKLFNKNTHDTKLQMLAYTTNSLFMNGKYEQSLIYASKLKTTMHEYNDLHYDKYVFFYYNSLVNNYSKTQPEKALEPLNEAKENKAIMKHPFYMGYVYLNLGVTYYNLQEYKLALKSLIKLYSHSNYLLLDETFRFNITMSELLIRYLLKDFEFILNRITQIQNEFKNVIKQQSFLKDKAFLKLLISLCNDAIHEESSKKTLDLIYDFKKTEKDNTPNEILNYIEFLELI